MLYTPMTKAAMKLCFEAHRNQVDKSGLPYVFHPILVAEQMITEEEVCVALLHDVMEDADFAAEDIRAAGMSERVIEALILMTHDPSVGYMDYVAALSVNPLARKVKMADLCHNMDTSRLDSMTEADWKRRDKYARAYALLEKAEAEEDARTRGREIDRRRSVLDVKRWLERLLDRGVDPETKVVIDRERGVNGYTYVDDLYCDDDKHPDDPVVLLGSYNMKTKAFRLMHRR